MARSKPAVGKDGYIDEGGFFTPAQMKRLAGATSAKKGGSKTQKPGTKKK